METEKGTGMVCKERDIDRESKNTEICARKKKEMVQSSVNCR